MSFDTDGPSNLSTPKPAIVEEEEEDTQPTNNAEELLRYHHQFGHISFLKLQLMAKIGVLPRRLQNCPVPVCLAYLYAKAIKKQWRYRTAKNQAVPNKPTKPGHLVLVDQLVSPTPGLVAQMTGILTTKRYKYATVYVDQVAKLSFTYLQKTATGEETIEGKESFERYALDIGVTIRAYHADNGIFRANKWVANCFRKGQPLTFAGVNTHHQNGLVERKIKEIQELERTLLIHAAKQWPKCVTTNLWPYTIRMANNILNKTTSFQDDQRRTPQQVFSGSNVLMNTKHWKPFGYPVYVLENSLQTGHIHHKWTQISKVGIYLS